eukprot:scaffold909_cov121-Isochrysis_galbana.AAC.13
MVTSTRAPPSSGFIRTPLSKPHRWEGAADQDQAPHGSAETPWSTNNYAWTGHVPTPRPGAHGALDAWGRAAPEPRAAAGWAPEPTPPPVPAFGCRLEPAHQGAWHSPVVSGLSEMHTGGGQPSTNGAHVKPRAAGPQGAVSGDCVRQSGCADGPSQSPPHARSSPGPQHPVWTHAAARAPASVAPAPGRCPSLPQVFTPHLNRHVSRLDGPYAGRLEVYDLVEDRE